MYSLANPMHPGCFLKEAYMDPEELTVTVLAEKIGVSVSSISRLVSEKSDLSYEMALRLSKVFKRTPEGWMNLQTAYGLAKTKVNMDKQKDI
jgi:addiction module HigA family antidote